MNCLFALMMYLWRVSFSKTYQEYKNIIENTKDKLVVLDLGTAKSEAYAFLTPRLEAAAKKFQDQALFITVDYMKVPQVYWDIRCPNIPTLIVFKNGQVIDAFVTTIEWDVEAELQKLLLAEKAKNQL